MSYQQSLPPVSTPGFDFPGTSVVGAGETASVGAAALSAADELSDLAPMLVQPDTPVSMVSEWNATNRVQLMIARKLDAEIGKS